MLLTLKLLVTMRKFFHASRRLRAGWSDTEVWPATDLGTSTSSSVDDFSTSSLNLSLITD